MATLSLYFVEKLIGEDEDREDIWCTVWPHIFIASPSEDELRRRLASGGHIGDGFCDNKDKAVKKYEKIKKSQAQDIYEVTSQHFSIPGIREQFHVPDRQPVPGAFYNSDPRYYSVGAMKTRRKVKKEPIRLVSYEVIGGCYIEGGGLLYRSFYPDNSEEKPTSSINIDTVDFYQK